MQQLSERVFKLSPPGGLFDETVMKNLFPEATKGALKLLVHRASKKGEILRLKPGLYILEKELRKTNPHPFAVAAMLHSPSNISLESALSFHGLIPEAVYQVSSVTLQRSRTYHTPLGVFMFLRVPSNQLRAGIEVVKLSDNFWAFVATPLRAIADLVYLTKRITWNENGLSYLTESLRIEKDDLHKISLDSFETVFESTRDRRTKEYLIGLKRSFPHD